LLSGMITAGDLIGDFDYADFFGLSINNLLIIRFIRIRFHRNSIKT